MFALFYHAVEHIVLIIEQFLPKIDQIFLELVRIVSDLLLSR